MKLKKILVVDDTELFAINISSRINNYVIDNIKLDCEYIIDSTSDLIMSNNYDTYFLDIDMPNCNGFDLAKKIIEIKPKAIIIFVTAHDGLVYNSFDLNPFYFIRKSNLEKDFEKAMGCLVTKFIKDDRFITLKYDSKSLNIDVIDIIYIEKVRNDLIIYAKNCTYTSRGSMDNMEKQINDHRFAKCHVSFMVNLMNISKLNENDLIVEDKYIPISRRYKTNFKQKYFDYLMGIQQ